MSRPAGDQAAAPEIDDPGCQLLLQAAIGDLPGDAPALLEHALTQVRPAAVLLRGSDNGDAARLRAVCKAHDVACLVADDLPAAVTLGADGLQQGAGLLDVAAVRARLGQAAIIGAACGGSRHAAMEAGEAGADYVAFGVPGQPVDDDLLAVVAWWHEIAVLPCLASAADVAEAAELAAAGADFIGIEPDLWTQPERLAELQAALRPAAP